MRWVVLCLLLICLVSGAEPEQQGQKEQGQKSPAEPKEQQGGGDKPTQQHNRGQGSQAGEQGRSPDVSSSKLNEGGGDLSETLGHPPALPPGEPVMGEAEKALMSGRMALQSLPGFGSDVDEPIVVKQNVVVGLPEDGPFPNVLPMYAQIDHEIQTADMLKNKLDFQVDREKEWARNVYEVISNYQFKYNKVLMDINERSKKSNELYDLRQKLKTARLHAVLRNNFAKTSEVMTDLKMMKGGDAYGKLLDDLIKLEKEEADKGKAALEPLVKEAHQTIARIVSPELPCSNDAVYHTMASAGQGCSKKPGKHGGGGGGKKEGGGEEGGSEQEQTTEQTTEQQTTEQTTTEQQKFQQQPRHSQSEDRADALEKKLRSLDQRMDEVLPRLKATMVAELPVQQPDPLPSPVVSRSSPLSKMHAKNKGAASSASSKSKPPSKSTKKLKSHPTKPAMEAALELSSEKGIHNDGTNALDKDNLSLAVLKAASNFNEALSKFALQPPSTAAKSQAALTSRDSAEDNPRPLLDAHQNHVAKASKEEPNKEVHTSSSHAVRSPVKASKKAAAEKVAEEVSSEDSSANINSAKAHADSPSTDREADLAILRLKQQIDKDAHTLATLMHRFPKQPVTHAK